MSHQNKRKMTSTTLDETLKQRVQQAIGSDRILYAFFQEPNHQTRLENVLSDPNEENMAALDRAFKEFYTEIRFIKYISKILYYEAIHFDQKERLTQKRMTLILDQTGEDDEEAWLSKLSNNHDEAVGETLDAQSENLEDLITNESVYHAFLSLTSKQRDILQLAYRDQLRDKDIAEQLGVSQQAISQSRRSALQKLKRALEGSAC
ncbi:sigma-70 family RNA polymerase sigma factor [Caldalkalibacillus salinus]|uniref:sigma-70 family RNA polymerase sigma factor n=1 Tax=Caldalkalibacillus salinus TaxID=2803787 RepID=UPI001922C775|nr:sigma-70 family RNA polymerase sigma factor [Caldalkalibacillus salinus]